MHDMLENLFAHQAWADAEHWRALEGFPKALEDAAIHERLKHIHLAQRAFLIVWRGEVFSLKALPEPPSMAVLKDDARRYHDDVASLLAAATPERLAETIVIPWFKDPPCRISLAQAMHQVLMHSHYHRGQNATRLRELGGRPPLTDLIVWYWKGEPRPEWS